MSSFQLRGEILEVKHLEGTPSFALGHHRARGAMGKGLKYEKKCQKHLGKLFGEMYLPGPWFAYRTSANPNVWNYAQPDGIRFDFQKGIITIVEFKYSHTIDAYFQLIDKYLPLLRKFISCPDLWRFATVEVVWWYDKAVAFPTEIRLRKDLSEVSPGEFAVHICRPN